MAEDRMSWPSISHPEWLPGQTNNLIPECSLTRAVGEQIQVAAREVLADGTVIDTDGIEPRLGQHLELLLGAKRCRRRRGRAHAVQEAVFGVALCLHSIWSLFHAEAWTQGWVRWQSFKVNITTAKTLTWPCGPPPGDPVLRQVSRVPSSEHSDCLPNTCGTSCAILHWCLLTAFSSLWLEWPWSVLTPRDHTSPLSKAKFSSGDIKNPRNRWSQLSILTAQCISGHLNI